MTRGEQTDADALLSELAAYGQVPLDDATAAAIGRYAENMQRNIRRAARPRMSEDVPVRADQVLPEAP